MKTEHILHARTHNSPLGPLVLAASARGLAGVWFDGQAHLPDWHRWPQAEHSPFLRQVAQQLDEYFRGNRKRFDLPLDLSAGTPFQQSVWHGLLDIGYGAHTSYGAIGQALGKPHASRAVGAAVGRNPIGIIVPCHRVLGAAGALTGYAGGLPRKTALLELESGASRLC